MVAPSSRESWCAPRRAASRLLAFERSASEDGEREVKEARTGDKMLRVGRRVLAEVGELGGRLAEESLALSADGRVEDLCRSEEAVSFRLRSRRKQ
jgi:hypothetical protein